MAMAGVGEAASVVGLLDFAGSLVSRFGQLYRQVKTWRSHWKSLEQSLNEVQRELRILKENGKEFQSPDDSNRIGTNLRRVNDLLTEIDGNPTRSDILCFQVPARVRDCVRTPIVVQKLEEATNLLDGVKHDIRRKAAVQVLSQTPTTSTALPALPSILVGKSRVDFIMQFLEKDDGVQVKAVVISGEGGLGKNTLLNWVLDEMEKKGSAGNMGRLIRAYVQVNREPDGDKIKSFQSSIILQLGGPELKLPSVFHGKTELHQLFNRMKNLGKGLCLAIDNVWTEKDLKELLPSNLGQSLPDGSCILITTRNRGIGDEMKRLCKSEEVASSSTAGTHHHVQLARERYTVEPHDLATLSQEDARELFQKSACLLTADGQSGGHKKLVDALVPLCGGFPLALEVLGVHFQKEENRKRWKVFVKRMQSPDGAKPGIVETDIMPILRCTYEQLPKSAQDAFVDITNYFIGWSWKKVSCIVGEEHMGDLRKRCLIKEQWDSSQWWSWKRKRIVAAHDLLRTLGESLRPGKLLRAVTEAPAQQLVDGIEGLWQKNKVIIIGVDALRKMTSLRVLRLCINFGLPDQFEHLHYLELDGHNSSARLAMGGCKRLSFLKLSWFSSDFTDAQFPRSLRRLYLCHCNKLLCLPVSIVRELTELEVLDIRQCPAMQVLPEDIGALEQLQKLAVRDAPDLIQLQPSLMEKLVGLEVFILEGCGLSMWKAADVHQLQKVELKSTRLEKLRLEGRMPVMLGVCHDALRELSLKNIGVCSDTDIESLLLPTSGNLNALQVLDLSGCKGLVSLPESIGRFSSLKTLDLSRCGDLRGLPESIGSLSCLQSLDLTECALLEGLPESLGELSSLQSLDLRGCALLEGLPESLGELSSLPFLDLRGCALLEGLPESLGELSSLRYLLLTGCQMLEQLPESIGQLCQLKVLSFWGCVRIERLPDGLAGIEVLEYLDVRGTGIRSIPGSNGQGISWPSLEILRVSDCKQLLELPEEVAKAVTSVKGCRQLKSCKGMYGLQRLEDVRGCENLRELPPWLLVEFRALALNQSTSQSADLLASAYELRSLQLPHDIDSMPAATNYNYPLSHMKELSLRLDGWSAESLQVQLNACTDVRSLELVGGTPSLVNLVLEALPPTIGLDSLTLKEIANMQEIPASISRFLPQQSDLQGTIHSQLETGHQQRPKLRDLHVEKCSSLTKLISFELISSLESLELSGCSNLSSFPGQLCSSIRQLTLKGLRSESADTICIAACLKWGLGEFCTLEECSATFLETVLHVETPWHDRTRYLTLKKVPDLEELSPLLFQRLPSLEDLSVYSCGSLRSVSQKVGMLYRLTWLTIEGCRQLREIPSEIGLLYSLKYLTLKWCTQLRELPSEICKLVALECLDVEGCISLAGLLPMLHHGLPRLSHLCLRWCSKVEEASLVHFKAVRPSITVVSESEEAKIRRQRWRSVAKRGMQRNASLVPADHQN